MHECLSGYEEGQASHCYLGEAVAAHPCYHRTSRNQTYVEYNYKYSSQESVLLDQEAVHVVRVDVGHRIFLCTVSASLTEETAFMHGNLRSIRLTNVVEDIVELLASRLEIVKSLGVVFGLHSACECLQTRHEISVSCLVESEKKQGCHDKGSSCHDEFLERHSSYHHCSDQYDGDEYGTGVTSWCYQRTYYKGRTVDVEDPFPERFLQKFQMLFSRKPVRESECGAFLSRFNCISVLSECMQGPCQVHHHGDLGDLVHMYLESEQTQCSPCSVEFLRIEKSELEMKVEYEEQNQCKEESGLGYPSENADLPDLIESDYHSQTCCRHDPVVLHDLYPAVIGEQGSR